VVYLTAVMVISSGGDCTLARHSLLGARLLCLVRRLWITIVNPEGEGVTDRNGLLYNCLYLRAHVCKVNS
jgi:hypothetical protein